ADALLRQIAVTASENMGIVFAAASDQAVKQLEAGYQVKSYYNSPRFLVTTTHQNGDQLDISLDLLRNQAFNIPYPGQIVSTALFFEVFRGFFESALEGQVVSLATGQSAVAITEVFDAMANQGARLVLLHRENLQDL